MLNQDHKVAYLFLSPIMYLALALLLHVQLGKYDGVIQEFFFVLGN